MPELSLSGMSAIVNSGSVNRDFSNAQVTARNDASQTHVPILTSSNARIESLCPRPRTQEEHAAASADEMRYEDTCQRWLMPIDETAGSE